MHPSFVPVHAMVWSSYYAEPKMKQIFATDRWASVLSLKCSCTIWQTEAEQSSCEREERDAELKGFVFNVSYWPLTPLIPCIQFLPRPWWLCVQTVPHLTTWTSLSSRTRWLSLWRRSTRTVVWSTTSQWRTSQEPAHRWRETEKLVYFTRKKL